MRSIIALSMAAIVIIGVPLPAQESKPVESRDQPQAQQNDSWTKRLTDRAQRGTLHDSFQSVRGDSGKWQDAPLFVHAPAIAQTAKMLLDDWADQSQMRGSSLTSSDDTWLLFRTRQLDDNDRVWVDRIERRGNQFVLVVHEAVWHGRYSKNFTYYDVLGVNLGKLEPGTYDAKCIINPVTFKQFEGSGQPRDKWPKDERPAERKTVELRAAFSVSSHDEQDLSGLDER